MQPPLPPSRIGSPACLLRAATAALVATGKGVVREPIIDYIANVLADLDFDFGPPDGHGIFEFLFNALLTSRQSDSAVNGAVRWMQSCRPSAFPPYTEWLLPR
ncbi:hypothetical protein BRADI_1g47363v3 [Brachypodium distachyon]|uniref:Uncharacterized protein n=1 Tax=Brachypodium distachyon TaxID=15368 RepID=A0A0Q3NNX6_BRADI|nr:hypothetical protein BRADI_1g47363v3 [Brachypodium distachyon]